jgi:GNAT superfamily N-acetyltransferase
MLYTIATITSPEEHAGKIVGYAGAGEYQDILVDAGTYVLGGRATEKYDVPNVRGQGIATKLRNKRNSFVEKMSRSSRKPYFAVVPAGPNSYTENLQNRGYIPNDEEIPKWAKRRLGQKFYLVYNTHRSMKKAWGIIRGV